MKTLEQQRAANALERVGELRGKSAEFKARYRAYVDRLGPAIIMNGLGQALATERAAAGPGPKSASEIAHRELHRNLQRWLCRQGGVYPPSGKDSEKDIPGDSDFLLQAVMENSESRYLHAQAEALTWLEWHKKSCRALLPKDAGTSPKNAEASPTNEGDGE